MADFKKALLGAVFIVMATTLGGCESIDAAVQGVGSRISSLNLSLPEIRSENKSYIGKNESQQNTGTGSPQEAPDTKETASAAPAAPEIQSLAAQQGQKNCPPINIIEELDSLHQFENPEKPSPETRISSVHLSNLKASCSYNHSNLVIDMELGFKGEIGSRAKTWNTDRPSFAYPYFMAITTHNGNIVAKEVFATTITYEKNQDHQDYTENLRQIIPLNSDSQDGYSILIGFQLTEGELAYNRALKNIAAPTEALPTENEPTKPVGNPKQASSKPILITPPRKPEIKTEVTENPVAPVESKNVPESATPAENTIPSATAEETTEPLPDAESPAVGDSGISAETTGVSNSLPATENSESSTDAKKDPSLPSETTAAEDTEKQGSTNTLSEETEEGVSYKDVIAE